MKAVLAAAVLCLICAGCSFDYGDSKAGSGKPDIVMQNVEYVRVRNAEPLVRFEAEYAERYEERKIMNLENFSFEQFENKGTEINAVGKAGEASVELESGNIKLTGGVLIAVESEDVTIETSSLHWKDREKQLTADADDEVEIRRTDGTVFTGRGFSADARERTWQFSSGAEGSYVDKPADADEEPGVPETESEQDELSADETDGNGDRAS